MADKDQDDKKKSFKSFKKDDKEKPEPKDEKKDAPEDKGDKKPVTNSDEKDKKDFPPKKDKPEPKKGDEDEADGKEKPKGKVGSKKPKVAPKDKKIDKGDKKVDGGEENVISGKKANNEVMINPDVEETGDENVTEALSYSERKRRGRTMKRFKKKLQIAKKRQSKRTAKQDRLKKRSRRGATNVVRQKVAGKKGKNYKNLSVGQKQAIDKRVARRKSMIDRVSKRLMPKTRKDDRKRLQRRVINDAFEMYISEAFLPEASERDTKPKKRYHEVFNKERKPKFDQRFKIFKTPVNEMADDELLEMVETFYEEHGAGEEGTDELVKRYKDDTPGQEDAELSEKYIEINRDKEQAILDKAFEHIDKMRASKNGGQSIEGYAFDIVRSFNLPFNARRLADLYRKSRSVKEEVEPMDSLFENNSCVLITRKQMKDFEKIVDKLFEKFGIDFEFTKHFGERMSHERNTPCITLKELAGLIKKIYAKQGKSLKKIAGSEAVIHDIQKHLNIPVVVKYDKKNDEFDVVAKTIMRKPNFKSPDQKIRY